MQQTHPAAQTSRLLTSAFYLLFSGSARTGESEICNSVSMWGAPVRRGQQLQRPAVSQRPGYLWGAYGRERGEESRAILGSGPGLSREVHFPFLLLTFTFIDLTYIYQGSLGAEETPLEIAVQAMFTSLQTPDLRDLVHITLEQIYPSTVLFLEFWVWTSPGNGQFEVNLHP